MLFFAKSRLKSFSCGFCYVALHSNFVIKLAIILAFAKTYIICQIKDKVRTKQLIQKTLQSLWQSPRRAQEHAKSRQHLTLKSVNALELPDLKITVRSIFSTAYDRFFQLFDIYNNTERQKSKKLFKV